MGGGGGRGRRGKNGPAKCKVMENQLKKIQKWKKVGSTTSKWLSQKAEVVGETQVQISHEVYRSQVPSSASQANRTRQWVT